MQFEFLGTGTSAGVPAIACDCAVCTSSDPRDKRLRTSGCLRFRDPQGRQRVILIDPGPDLRQQALRARLQRVDAILITHNHVDHTFGLDEVRRFNVVMGRAIDVYAEERTFAALRRVFAHIFDAASNIQPSFVASLIPHRIEPGLGFELYGVRVMPLRLLHGRLPVLGFRFDPIGRSTPDNPLPLAYCTDVSAIPPQTWRELSGLRTLVLDGLRHRRHPTHLSIGQAVAVARQVAAEQTYFVHMSHEVSHAAMEEELPESIRLAYDGLVLGSVEETGDCSEPSA
ncbi:MAG: MBL fold metallo-hydrolase [Phycisphaerales bacterium]